MATNIDPQIIKKEPGYRDLAERLADYNEVEKMLSTEEAQQQAERCMSCGTPFCHGYACPLANIIPETNELVLAGRWQDALEIMLSTHPFPEFTARICPALCEGSCVLGINEEPVSIRQLEKMIIEKGFAAGWVTPRPPQKRRAESIAVIGSGPCGLAAADRLNKNGFSVTVFEKERNPGGLLMYGIPNFKLEKEVIRRRIEIMKQEGIVFECNVTVGSDISFKYLQSRFAAVLLSGGAQEPRDLKVPGRGLKGIYFAMDYLKAQNKRIIGEPLAATEDITAEGKSVVIIGGGDTGSDCLGTALRQGAAQAYQFEIMPRAPIERSPDNPWPLWPHIDRESSSHQEGGTRRWRITTKRFEGNEDGAVTRLHCAEVEWINDGGRFVPEEKEHTDFSVKADLVLLAMGFVGPGADPLAAALELERDERGNIRVNDHHLTSIPGVFSAGDMAHGQSLVVRAMADGIAAANDISSALA